MSDVIYDYWWVSKTIVPSIDDKEDMIYADDYEAYDIFGFINEEKYNIYKLTPVVMHMGNFIIEDFVQWVKRSRLKSR